MPPDRARGGGDAGVSAAGAFRAVMAIEIGGGNGIQPLMAAAHLGMPVVDADAMGRAYPGGADDQLRGRRPAAVPADARRSARQRGDRRPRRASWKWMERVSRKICTEFGSIAATCKAPRTGRRGEATGASLHHHPGDPPRATRCDQRIAGARRSRSRRSCGTSMANCCSPARSSKSNAAPPKAFCAAAPRCKGWTTIAAQQDRTRVPERMARGVA